MGSFSSDLCCNEPLHSEVYYSESLQPLESKTYRANEVKHDKSLESIEQCNKKVHEPDEMEKINQLLDMAESRIETLNSRSKSRTELIKLAKTVEKKIRPPSKKIQKKNQKKK